MNTPRCIPLALSFATLLLVTYPTPIKAQLVDAESITEAQATNPTVRDDLDIYEDRMKKLDPLEPLNRSIFALNTFMDRLLIQHLARAYKDLVPQPAQNRVSDFLNNLAEPVIALNDFLQGDVKQGLTSLTRFFINSTFGLLGLFDVVGRHGLKRKPNDLDTTLRKWGIAAGPYIVLPLFGPSSFRNVIGDVGEFYVDPYNWYMRNTVKTEFAGTHGGYPIYIRRGMSALVQRADVLKITDKLDKTADPYAQYRILYLQSRRIIDAVEESAVPADIVTDSDNNSVQETSAETVN